MPILISLVSKFWPYIVGALSVVSGVLYVYFKGRRDANIKNKVEAQDFVINKIKELPKIERDLEKKGEQILQDLQKSRSDEDYSRILSKNPFQR